jgi:hypothetical protein
MKEATASDNTATVLEELTELELQHGRLAGETQVLEQELKHRTGRRAQIALEAALGDEETLAEYERLQEEEGKIASRLELLSLALPTLEEHMKGLRRTWLRKEGQLKAIGEWGSA